MSLIDQLAQLEARMQELSLKCRQLEQENQALLEGKNFLQTQCELLDKKKELARKKVEQLLSQLTKMEVSHE